MQHQDIYSYTDFRNFLRDYYHHQKEKSPTRFSYRAFAKKAGFSSPNFFHRLINGSRNLGLKNLHRISKSIGLNQKESAYLEALVQFNQTQNLREKELFYDKMFSTRNFKESRLLSQDQYEFYSRWYLPIIREMVNLKSFSEDPLWISSKLQKRITPSEAEQALQTLLRLQLLQRDEKGQLKMSDSHITTGAEIRSVALFKFHNQMIEQGRQSLHQPAEEREVSSITMSLSRSQFQMIRERVREFQQEVQKLIAQGNEAESESVYQLNFQLFDFLSPHRRPL